MALQEDDEEDEEDEAENTGSIVVETEAKHTVSAAGVEAESEEKLKLSAAGTARGSVLPTTFYGRVAAVLSLWIYMVPLFLVYFAEYAMQSGTWAAIGFPVTDKQARDSFYQASNWAYQGGVFVSRSSGMLFRAGRRALWAMGAVQWAFLVFFWANAALQFWYDWSLLLPCFVTGLLGGAVYVGAFALIAEQRQGRLREFSLSAASVADSVGIVCADLLGILIQSQLYALHRLGKEEGCGNEGGRTTHTNGTAHSV